MQKLKSIVLGAAIILVILLGIGYTKYKEQEVKNPSTAQKKEQVKPKKTTEKKKKPAKAKVQQAGVQGAAKEQKAARDQKRDVKKTEKAQQQAEKKKRAEEKKRAEKKKRAEERKQAQKDKRKKDKEIKVASLANSSTSLDSKNPFPALRGSWRGKGTVTPVGSKVEERVSCRVNYNVQAKVRVTQVIRCAGNGYWLRATSRFRYTPGNKEINGSWSANYGDKVKPKEVNNGKISGAFFGNVISMNLNSNKFSKGMTIKLTGRQQVVEIDGVAKFVLRR